MMLPLELKNLEGEAGKNGPEAICLVTVHRLCLPGIRWLVTGPAEPRLTSF
jgi:hypothetical protein